MDRITTTAIYNYHAQASMTDFAPEATENNCLMYLLPYVMLTLYFQCFDAAGRQEGHPACKKVVGCWHVICLG